MARRRPKAATQRALTILKPLRDASERAALESILRGHGNAMQSGGNSALRDAFDAIEGLHYLSWFVIDGVESASNPGAFEPPVLVLEANFDGAEKAFLRRLAGNAATKALLDEIYSRCSGYPVPGSSAEFTAHCLALGNSRPEVFYVARPGQSAAQLKEEARLAAAIEAAVGSLGEPYGRRLEHLRRIWDRLGSAQRRLIPNAPMKPFWVRHSLREQPLKAVFALVALLAVGGLITLALIGLDALGAPLWECLVPPRRVADAALCAALVLAALAGAGLVIWALFHVIEAPKDIRLSARVRIWGRKFRAIFRATIRTLPAALALVGVVAFLSWQGALLLHWASYVVLGLLAIALLAGLLLVLVAMRELVDGVDGMAWDPAKLTRLSAREDRGVQNHFISVTPVKPGRLRQAVLRIVLFLVNLLARVLYDRRGLAGIPSIHFARWQLLDGGQRLLFVTNYDGGWGGYLGDFVATAAFGMNAIWGSSGGFPRTFYLFFDGVKDEQRFKCYARNSQQETLFWYQRYPELSLAAIRRNAEMREELARLSEHLAPGAAPAAESELDAFLRRFAVPGR